MSSSAELPTALVWLQIPPVLFFSPSLKHSLFLFPPSSLTIDISEKEYSATICIFKIPNEIDYSSLRGKLSNNSELYKENEDTKSASEFACLVMLFMPVALYSHFPPLPTFLFLLWIFGLGEQVYRCAHCLPFYSDIPVPNISTVLANFSLLLHLLLPPSYLTATSNLAPPSLSILLLSSTLPSCLPACKIRHADCVLHFLPTATHAEKP